MALDRGALVAGLGLPVGPVGGEVGVRLLARSFEEVAQLGLECDVCLTAAGRLALLHDPILETGTTATGWAHRTPWASLSKAHVCEEAAATGFARDW